jgi:hypothetical protein
MKRYLLIIAIVSICFGTSNNANAQYYFYNDNYYDAPITYEVGASVGVMNCFTDLGGKAGIGKKFTKDLNMGYNQIAFGGFFGVNYRQAIGLRFEATFGKVSANDQVLKSFANTNDPASARYHRNLNFESSITELSLLAEIHPLFIFINWGESENEPPKFSPYLLAGIGSFSFNPKAKLGNNLVDLQPLSTEGQGFAEYPDRPIYKLRQMNYPLGLGLKYEVSPLINMRAEFVYRVLSTDYLDDCSTNYIDPTVYENYFSGTKLRNAVALSDRQYEINDDYHKMGPGSKRGSPDQNDSYFSFNFKISLTLGRARIRD